MVFYLYIFAFHYSKMLQYLPFTNLILHTPKQDYVLLYYIVYYDGYNLYFAIYLRITYLFLLLI